MIEIRDDDKYVIAIRDFYKRKKTPIRAEDPYLDDSLPCDTVLYHHFGTYCLEEINVAVLGVKPTSVIFEEHIKKRSQDGTKKLFYTNSRDIAGEAWVSSQAVGHYIAGVIQKGLVVAGYRCEYWAGKNHGRRCIAAVKQEDYKEAPC
jgi:hypothetical protein